MGGSVDDIWAQLKAKTAPSQHAKKAMQVLAGAQGMESSQSSKSAKSTERQFDLPVAPHGGRKSAASDATAAAATATATSSSGTFVPAAATPVVPAYEDYDALQTGVARDLNTLADAQGSPGTRVKALQRIRAVIDTISLEVVREGGGSAAAAGGARAKHHHSRTHAHTRRLSSAVRSKIVARSQKAF
jgi:hypothetical protein